MENLTDEQAKRLLEEISKLSKGPLGPALTNFSLLQVDIDALCGEMYILREYESHKGADALCDDQRAAVAVETIADMLKNEFPHYASRLLDSLAAYALSQGWDLPPLLEEFKPE